MQNKFGIALKEIFWLSIYTKPLIVSSPPPLPTISTSYCLTIQLAVSSRCLLLHMIPNLIEFTTTSH